MDKGFFSSIEYQRFDYCDHCQEAQPEGAPYWPLAGKQICQDCIYHTIEEYIKFNLGGVVPYQIMYLVDKHTPWLKRRTTNKNLKAKILRKYKHRCAHCDATENLEIDHIKPYSKGGKDIPSNLQVLCKTCNLKKGVKYNAEN